MKKIFIILLPLFVLLGVLNLQLNSSAWHNYILVLLPQTDYQLQQQQADLLAYFKDQSVLKRQLFSAAEINHIEDIKKVMNIIRPWLLNLWLLTGLGLLLIWQEAGKAKIIQWTGQAAGRAVFMIIVIGATCLLGFNLIFETFHLLIFPQGNWHFDPRTDLIIRLYPPEFMFYFLVAWLVSSLATLCLLWLLFYYSNSKARIKADVIS